ncbi:hypothetical protein S40285_01313 [Stachybotrys chlorohalonatus IBT 40285]|uniref:Uncharacterized protein n=2 Tax=Stachybotrys TaxID=74721 RepID=A0A084QR35_STAC4|nr:hypothetical protein S7711_07349 [Stachybotrys chartarum IBT 7711]KFA52033.1 hypothetical protein S40293_02931 [Stachybotrys chartarum IBT 40293]KFA66420.1 hypothetical protein S40285_01313 [Stachybotrys chlorohalonata IBT 40285]KFA74171.1 hypothetical protein S40288_06545 [Stachybotrys chartarum IBT 40288]
MPLMSRTARTHRAPVTSRRHHTTTTRTTRSTPRRGFFSSRTRARAPATTTHTHVVHHHRRKPTMKDKISGALLKLRGSLTRRPAVKAAGTRRMHGTDGRGSRRHRY